jgi:hypothetical protein
MVKIKKKSWLKMKIMQQSIRGQYARFSKLRIHSAAPIVSTSVYFEGAKYVII